MRRLICAFVVRIWHKPRFLMTRLIYVLTCMTIFGLIFWHGVLSVAVNFIIIVFCFQDRYILISMIFVSLITFWHAILSQFHYDTDLQSRLDFGVFITFAVVYFIFQVIFIIVMMYQVSFNFIFLKNITIKHVSLYMITRVLKCLNYVA